MVMLLLWVSGLSVFFPLLIVFGPLLGCCSLRVGSGLGSRILSLVVAVLLRLGTPLLDIEEVLSGVVDSDVHLFVADVIKSFDTVDRDILGKVLSSLGLPGWFRHAFFEYHSHVRLRFKLAAGLGQPWTRDGGIPHGDLWSMIFIVTLYLPWCRYLGAQEGVEPQLYADNLKCVSRNPAALLRAARFTVGYVRLVGQERAPRKCVLMSTSRAVRSDMREWVVIDEGDRWSVKLDVRDLGRHLDSTFRGLLGFVLSFFGWFLSLLSRWTFMGGSGLHGPCFSLVLCVVLRLLFLLKLVYVSCGLLLSGLYGPVVSLLQVLVRCSVC